MQKFLNWNASQTWQGKIRNLNTFQAITRVPSTHLPLSLCKPREESSLPGDCSQPFTLIQQDNIKQTWKMESGLGSILFCKNQKPPQYLIIEVFL